jgi:hypothetical protein
MPMLVKAPAIQIRYQLVVYLRSGGHFDNGAIAVQYLAHRSGEIPITPVEIDSRQDNLYRALRLLLLERQYHPSPCSEEPFHRVGSHRQLGSPSRSAADRARSPRKGNRATQSTSSHRATALSAAPTLKTTAATASLANTHRARRPTARSIRPARDPQQTQRSPSDHCSASGSPASASSSSTRRISLPFTVALGYAPAAVPLRDRAANAPCASTPAAYRLLDRGRS